MNEPLPSRRHSFACVPNESLLNPIDAGELIYYAPPPLDASPTYRGDSRRGVQVLVDEEESHRGMKDSTGSSYYGSPPTSLFFAAASSSSPRPSTSDVHFDHSYHHHHNNHSASQQFEPIDGHYVDGPEDDDYSRHYPIDIEEPDSVVAWTAADPRLPPAAVVACRPILSSCPGKSYSKKNRKKTAKATEVSSNDTSKPIRVTTFNLKPTYIPPPTPRMSMCGPGCECDGMGQSHHHHLISTNEYVVTIEQLKAARERAREKVRRIVVGVSVTLTLLAVVLVTAFLALGSRLEQQERNGKQQLFGKNSPFVEEELEGFGRKRLEVAAASAAAAANDAQSLSTSEYRRAELSGERRDRNALLLLDGKSSLERRRRR